MSNEPSQKKPKKHQSKHQTHLASQQTIKKINTPTHPVNKPASHDSTWNSSAISSGKDNSINDKETHPKAVTSS